MPSDSLTNGQPQEACRLASLEVADDSWFSACPAVCLIPDLLAGREVIDLAAEPSQASNHVFDELRDVLWRLTKNAQGPGRVLLHFEGLTSILPTLTHGGNVRLAAYALTDGQVGLVAHLHPIGTSSQVTVEATKELILLGQEWYQEVGRLKRLSAAQNPESKAAQEGATSEEELLRRQFAERLLSTLSNALWIDLSHLDDSDLLSLVTKWRQSPARFAQRIEQQLALQNVKLAVDGQYHATLLQFGKAGSRGLLVSYNARHRTSAVRELIEFSRANVPNVFRTPLLTEICPPGSSVSGRVLPTDLSGIMATEDIGDQDELPQEAEQRARAGFQQHGSEAFGWYQSCHSWDDAGWGIVLDVSRVNDLGRALMGRLAEAGCSDKAGAFELAKRLIWKHEFFHAQLDFFGLGQELVLRKPLVLPYSEHVYSTTEGTSGALEEALANYAAWTAVSDLVCGRKGHRGWNQEAAAAAMQFIEELFDFSPPGYSDWRLGADPLVWRRLLSQLLEGRSDVGDNLPPLEAWLRQPLVTQEEVPLYWWTADATLADRLFATPSRREAERLLRNQGYWPSPRRGAGSHILWESSDGRSFPLPHRDPLSQHVFHSLLRHIGISKQDYLRFRKSL